MLPLGETGCVLLEILRDSTVVEKNTQTQQTKAWKQQVLNICVGNDEQSQNPKNQK